jgi:transcription termination/antitermination protein NusG
VCFTVHDFSLAYTTFTRFIDKDSLWFHVQEEKLRRSLLSVELRGIDFTVISLAAETLNISKDQLLGLRMAKPYTPMHINPQDNTEPGLLSNLLPSEWFAVRTRPRHEKVVTSQLETIGIESFLPLYSQVRSWSDRRKTVDFPLFPGYIFVQTSRASQERVRVFQVRGVLGFVGPNNQATPIPTHQIEAVRSLLKSNIDCRPHPYLNIGQRVRIQNGALQGLEGILVRIASDHSLVVSVDLIHRSVSIRLEGYEVDSL